MVYVSLDAIEKISALESELSKLKAQIAIYALAEVGSEDQDYVPAPPPPPPPPLPMATPSLEVVYFHCHDNII